MADPDRPLLGRGDHRTNLGLPNPDNVYWLARIEPGADYRIVGTRGTSADLTFQLLAGYPGTGTLGTNAGLLRSTDLAVAPDGKIVLSAVLDPDDDCFFCDTTAVLIRLIGPSLP